ncbi:MAG: protease family protein [Verrucomicrobiota bacterium]
MLTVKPWKSEAIVRLLLSVFICFFVGSLLVSTLHHSRATVKGNASFSWLAGGALVCLATTLVLFRRPWNFEKSIRRAVILVGFLYAGLFLGAWAQQMAGPMPAGISVEQMLIATLSFQGATILLVGLLLREHQVSWSEAFGFTNRAPHAVLLGLIALGLALPVLLGMQWMIVELMQRIPHFPVKPVEQQAVQTLRIATSWVDRLALGAVTILLVPVGEEMLFRGVLYPWIKQSGFPRLAVWGTSLVFAAIHQNMVAFLPLLVLALLFTGLYERTNNLLAPISAHAAFNAVNFAVLYLAEKQIAPTH